MPVILRRQGLRHAAATYVAAVRRRSPRYSLRGSFARDKKIASGGRHRHGYAPRERIFRGDFRLGHWSAIVNQGGKTSTGVGKGKKDEHCARANRVL